MYRAGSRMQYAHDLSSITSRCHSKESKQQPRRARQDLLPKSLRKNVCELGHTPSCMPMYTYVHMCVCVTAIQR